MAGPVTLLALRRTVGEQSMQFRRLRPLSLTRKVMAKTQRKLKKANHGKRPASAKARRLKRKHIKT